MDKLVKELLGNSVVASLAKPHAVAITPTDMEPEGHSFKTANDLVVGLYGASQLLTGMFTPLAHGLDRTRIHIGRISRGIDLDIAAACIDQAREDLSLHPHHIGHKIVLETSMQKWDDARQSAGDSGQH